VSDLSTIPAIPDNDNAEPGRPSPWAMLATMLLLIAGLLLASATMLYFAWKKGSGTGSSFELASLINTVMDDASKIQAEEKQPAAGQIKIDRPEEIKPDTLPKTSGTSKVKWPRLKLTGFGSSSDGEGGFAIINGNQIFLNQYIGKVRLLEVRAHDVVVECQGEQKTLTVEFKH
jgi:hypothetical protein